MSVHSSRIFSGSSLSYHTIVKRVFHFRRVFISHVLVVLWVVVCFTSAAIDEDEVYCAPEQVHLSYGDVTLEMVVMWSTKNNCSTSLVYGKTPWNFNITVTGESKNFIIKNEDGFQFLHRVKLKDLSPSTTYFYRSLSNDIGAGPFYFKTPPSRLIWSPKFLVYGDLGVHTYSIPKLTTEALTGKYTAVLHVGDFGYDLRDNRGQLGDQFMRLIQSIASELPYMTSVGNHEIDEDTFAHYRYRFSMPRSDWPIPLDKMWYSIDVGSVHFISYSTEVFFTLDEKYVTTQRDWLIKDLEKANQNRNKCPWVIAFGHRPMYCSNDDGDDCTKPESKVRAGFEDIFYHFGVDIVLQAHEHSYERLWPQYKGIVLSEDYVNPAAPIQLVTGAAGSRHGVDTMNNTEYAPWSAFRKVNGSMNSYGKMIVANTTHLYWEQRSVIENYLIDSVWIVQENHGPFKTDRLPENVSDVIEQTIASTGGKLDFRSTEETEQKTSIYEGDRTQRLAIGISFGSLAVVVIIVLIAVKKCRRKRKLTRRWEQLDINYGKKFYSSSKDADRESDNDFEIDMSDGSLPTTKLLSED